MTSAQTASVAPSMPLSRLPATVDVVNNPCAWQTLLVRPNINRCVVVSKWRCLVTLCSLALLVSDIPRTGLGVRSLADYYSTLSSPDSAIRFGPYAYPVAHIRRTSGDDDHDEVFAGSKGSNPIESTRVWSYKYDTTSIGLRGAVELLGVSDFPPDLIYHSIHGQTGQQMDTLSLSTTFHMLDVFVSAVRAQVLSAMESNAKAASWGFATEHYLIDRLHHHLLRSVRATPAWRVHTLHIFAPLDRIQPLGVCSAASARQRPRFCDQLVQWYCSNPLNESLPAVPLWHHMDLRLQMFQKQYPDLDLEVVILSTHKLSSTAGALRSTYYSSDTLEIVVLTRGRRCPGTPTEPKSQCVTVFMDDFRYERDTVHTDVVDWYPIISALRGSAQGYVWVRLVLLCYVAYAATDTVTAPQSTIDTPGCLWRIPLTISLLLKIPFQVIVYGSMLPVVCYVAALLLDSNFMDIFLEAYWASVGGTTNNWDIVTFLKSTAVHMRSVWVLALLVSVILSVGTRSVRDSNEGRPGIRGLVISFTSMLSVFGPYKHLSFRNTANKSVLRLADWGHKMELVRAQSSRHVNKSSYLYDDSVTMMLLSIAVVAALTAVTKGLLVLGSRCMARCRGLKERDVVLGSTSIVPCASAKLWPASMLSHRFYIKTTPLKPADGTPAVVSNNVRVAPEPLKGVIPESSHAWVSPWSATDVLPNGPSVVLGDLEREALAVTVEAPGGLRPRTPEVQSALQLLNTAMMTDPLSFLWLRVVGIQLYLYKICRVETDASTANKPVRTSSAGLDDYAVILPYRPDEIEEQTGLGPGEFQLVAWASSRDLPMAVLLQCG